MNRAEFVLAAGAAAIASPAADAYAGARDGIRAIIAREDADAHLIKEALPRLYEHGARADLAVVLLHGFTNVPQQFDALARRLYARGCNVYVPRLPRHGNADRLTQGLGRSVAVLGLSLGGTMALWMAQNLPLDLALAVAPFVTPVNISRAKGLAAARLASVVPDIYFWWDKNVKEKSRPVYAYPGYPSHGMAPVHDIIDPTTFPQGEWLVYPRLEALMLEQFAAVQGDSKRRGRLAYG